MSGSQAKPAVSRPKGVTGKNLGVLSLALFAAALLLMAWAGYEMHRGLDTLDWPETQGTITSSGVRKEIRRESGSSSRQSTTYYPEIRYAYQANGRSYTGTNINIGGKTGGMEWLAQRAVKKYPSGKNVSVHYRPDNPSEAVLKAGNCRQLDFYAADGGGVSGGRCIVLSGIFKKPQPAANGCVTFLMPLFFFRRGALRKFQEDYLNIFLPGWCAFSPSV